MGTASSSLSHWNLDSWALGWSPEGSVFAVILWLLQIQEPLDQIPFSASALLGPVVFIGSAHSRCFLCFSRMEMPTEHAADGSILRWSNMYDFSLSDLLCVALGLWAGCQKEKANSHSCFCPSKQTLRLCVTLDTWGSAWKVHTHCLVFFRTLVLMQLCGGSWVSVCNSDCQIRKKKKLKWERLKVFCFFLR